MPPKAKKKITNDKCVFFSEAKSCADGLFQEVLGRKDKADSTRNALSVLQRFKFLFYLPLNIDRNIKRVSCCMNKLRYSIVAQV